VSDTGSGAQRQEVLAAVLRHERALVAALASDGVLVQVPGSLELPGHRVLAPIGDRATMLDLVVPADAMSVVAAWEQARAHGVGFGHVHARTDPDEALSLTFVDARDEHGVFLGSLEVLATDAGDGPQALETVPVSRTPRTGTVRKSMLAVITDVDERTTRMLGWTREQMVGTRSSDFIHPDDQAAGHRSEQQEDRRVRRPSRGDQGGLPALVPDQVGDQPDQPEQRPGDAARDRTHEHAPSGDEDHPGADGEVAEVPGFAVGGGSRRPAVRSSAHSEIIAGRQRTACGAGQSPVPSRLVTVSSTTESS
jgi:PAS domain-containing protein